jgi:SAM-dependent methyltransferase
MEETAAKYCREIFGLTIKTGTIDSVLSSEDRFDVITMFDYLEHSVTPADDINKLLNHLNPDGLLIIRVPNQEGLQSKYMKKNWIALISNHISYFAPDVISEYLKKKGCLIEKIFANNYHSQFDILMQRLYWAKEKLAAKYLKQHSSLKLTEGNPAPSSGSVKKLIYSLFIEQLDHVGGWFNQGNNLMSIARKK